MVLIPPGDLYRFDGVQFLPWRLPAAVSTNRAVNVFADRAGGLWILGPRDIVRLKNKLAAAQFPLEATMFQGISEDPDGSFWLLTGSLDAPLCHLTDGAVKCFGKADGIPISRIDTLLADGRGGFWLGGQTALVHWHGGVSETYRISGAKPTGIGIQALARGPDGSLWVGILAEGPGLGLTRFQDGALKTEGRFSFMLFRRNGTLKL